MVKQTSRFSLCVDPRPAKEGPTKPRRVRAPSPGTAYLEHDGTYALVQTGTSTVLWARHAGETVRIYLPPADDSESCNAALAGLEADLRDAGFRRANVLCVGFKARAKRAESKDPVPSRAKPETLGDKIGRAMHAGYQPAIGVERKDTRTRRAVRRTDETIWQD